MSKPLCLLNAMDDCTVPLSLALHAWLPRVTDTMGPGVRSVVWVQGCTLRCPGCMSPDTWDTESGSRVSPLALANEIIAVPGIEGITVSGGEPTAQAAAVTVLLTKAKESGLNTWVYSGHTIEELVALNDPAIDGMLSVTDVLVDGRFQQEGESLRYRGSGNQCIIPLSGDIPKSRLSSGQGSRFEITLDSEGHMTLLGMPPRGFFLSFQNALVQRGINLQGEHWLTHTNKGKP